MFLLLNNNIQAVLNAFVTEYLTFILSKRKFITTLFSSLLLLLSLLLSLSLLLLLLRAKRAFWSVQWHGFSLYIYIFQAVRRAVNVLNVSTCI